MCSVEAYMQIYTRYLKKIYNYSVGITKDYDASQDIAQQTLIKVFEYKYRYEPTFEFSTWIYTIVKNLSLNELRRLGKFIEHEPGHDPRSQFEKYMSHDYIRKKISELPEIYIDVIISRYIECYTFKEIAELTGKNINTLKAQAMRGLELLKQLIEKDAVEKTDI
jgi:RNA polymerase sigma-70 factor, ECF subfamily